MPLGVAVAAALCEVDAVDVPVVVALGVSEPDGDTEDVADAVADDVDVGVGSGSANGCLKSVFVAAVAIVVHDAWESSKRTRLLADDSEVDA